MTQQKHWSKLPCSVGYIYLCMVTRPGLNGEGPAILKIWFRPEVRLYPQGMLILLMKCLIMVKIITKPFKDNLVVRTIYMEKFGGINHNIFMKKKEPLHSGFYFFKRCSFFPFSLYTSIIPLACISCFTVTAYHPIEPSNFVCCCWKQS